MNKQLYIDELRKRHGDSPELRELEKRYSLPEVKIDPEVEAKKTTSYILGRELNLTPEAVNSGYSSIIKNVYGEQLKPSAVQKRLQDDGFLASPKADDEDIRSIADAVMSGSELPKDVTERLSRKRLIKHTSDTFYKLTNDEDEMIAGNIQLLTKPDKPDTIYSMPDYNDADLLDINRFKGLLEQASSKQQVDELRQERKSLVHKLYTQTVKDQSLAIEKSEMSKFTTGSKASDVSLEAAKGLYSALNTISRGTWSASVAMGMTWNQPNVDAIDEALKTSMLTPIEASGKIGYVSNAIGSAIPSFLYNMSIGGSGIFTVEYGNAYQDAIDSGATPNQANLEAVPIATINTIIEYAQIDRIFKFAGGGKAAKYTIKKIVKERAIKSFVKAGAKFTGKSIKTAINEGLEGAAQQGVQFAFPALFRGKYPTDDNGNVDWLGMTEQIGQSFVGEGLGGLFLGVSGGVYNARKVSNAKQNVAAYLVVNEGLSETDALKVATNIVERVANNDGDGKEIYREEVGKLKSSDRRQKAAVHLIKKGKEMPEEQYRQIASDTTGKNSVKDMNYDEAERFITALKEAKVEKKVKTEKPEIKAEIEAIKNGEVEEIPQPSIVSQSEEPTREQATAKEGQPPVIERSTQGEVVSGVVPAPMGYIKAIKNANGKYEVKMGDKSPDNPFTKEVFSGEFNTPKIARKSYEAWFIKQQSATIPPIAKDTAARNIPSKEQPKREDGIPEGYKVYDRGETYRDSYGIEKPVKPDKRYGILTKDGLNTGVYGSTQEQAIENFNKANKEIAKQKSRKKTPLEMTPEERISNDISEVENPNTGKSENVRNSDIIDVVESELQKAGIAKSGQSSISNSRYFGDEDNRIRVSDHSVANEASQSKFFIGIGTQNLDADIIIPENATVAEIKAATKQAIKAYKQSSFNPPATTDEKIKKRRRREGRFLDNTPFVNKKLLNASIDELLSTVSNAKIKPVVVGTAEKEKTLKKLKRISKLDTLRTTAEGVISGLDRLAGLMSTRLKNISPVLFQEVRNRYINPTKIQVAERTREARPFIDNINKKLSDIDRYDFEVAQWQADVDTINSIVSKYNLQNEYAGYRSMLDEMYHEGNYVGMDIDYKLAYFPSAIKDFDGLLKELDSREEYAPIVMAMREAQKAKGNRQLSKDEQIQMLDSLLRGYQVSGLTLAKPSFAKERTLIRDDESLMKYYYGFEESTSRYIEAMTDNINARKFFGKTTKELVDLRASISRAQTSIAKIENGTTKAKNPEVALKSAKTKLTKLQKELQEKDDGLLKNSIGAYVLDLIENGTIKYDQQVELQQIFDGIFKTTSSHKWIHTLRSLEYAGSLAQIPSIITQYSEIVLSLLKSPTNTLPSFVRVHFNKSKIKLSDIGVAHIGQEWADADLDKTITTILKPFEFADKVGKETFINSVIDKYRKQAKTNPEAVKKELSKYYPESALDSIISSLVSGVVDDNVKGFALNELADVQPISKMEVPELYSKAGNLRVFYMYKTFVLKRIDILRNQGYNEIKEGIKAGDNRRVLKGIAKLIWLAFMFTLADASADVVKDIIRGRPLGEIENYVFDNMLQMILLSKYSVNKTTREGLDSFLKDNIALPISNLDAAFRDVMTLMDEDSEKGSELAKRISWVGDLYYWYFGEGARKIEDGVYDNN